MRTRVRRRQLAGDARAGSWARSRTRDIHWRWVRREWRFIAGSVGVMTAAVSVIAFFTHSVFARGLIVGGAAVGTFAALVFMVVLVTGTAYRNMGATGEVWTASELRPLRRAGWRIVNHVALQRWDIDHVLVGPGGVIAVETKWSADGWALDPTDASLKRAIEQVQRNARDLRLWHDLKSLGVNSVGSVVFLWGYDALDERPRPSEPITVNGTTVVYGVKAATVWRESIRTAAPSVSAARVDEYWNALATHVTKRETRDRLVTPPRPSMFSIYWQAIGTLLSTFAAVYLFGEALKLRLAIASVAVLIAMGTVGLLARRFQQTRYIALGWLTAFVVCLVALGLLELIRPG